MVETVISHMTFCHYTKDIPDLTCILPKLCVGRLKEDFYAIERCYRRLGLGR
jgi:hypothetical protein